MTKQHIARKGFPKLNAGFICRARASEGRLAGRSEGAASGSEPDP